MTAPLVLVGCGKMGAAMLQGWLQRDLKPADVYIVEPNAEAGKAIAAKYGVNAVIDAGGLPDDIAPETVVLAVKPQSMDAALPAYARYVRPECLFLSIAAGKTIAYFERYLGDQAAIVRAMPNTPAAVGRGITVLCANANVTATARDRAERLLAAVGEVATVSHEALIDPVTALSGGGPAYVFLLVEVMAEAGRAAGLPAELAMRLARITVAGAGELLHQATDDPATLRKNVTSPGGTTAEALKILMADDAWQPLMTKAIAAATKRSRELAG